MPGRHSSRERAERWARFNFASSPHLLLLALPLPPATPPSSLNHLPSLLFSLSFVSRTYLSSSRSEPEDSRVHSSFFFFQQTPIERPPLASSRVDPLPPFDPPPSLVLLKHPLKALVAPPPRRLNAHDKLSVLGFLSIASTTLVFARLSCCKLRRARPLCFCPSPFLCFLLILLNLSRSVARYLTADKFPVCT